MICFEYMQGFIHDQSHWGSLQNFEVVWDASSVQGPQVSAGIYFNKISAGDFVQTRKMILIK